MSERRLRKLEMSPEILREILRGKLSNPIIPETASVVGAGWESLLWTGAIIISSPDFRALEEVESIPHHDPNTGNEVAE